jgi:hypothetical protein
MLFHRAMLGLRSDPPQTGRYNDLLNIRLKGSRRHLKEIELDVGDV